MVLGFVKNRTHLEAVITRAFALWNCADPLWMAWPKQAGQLASDLDFSTIQAAMHPHGMVDVRACALDMDWSALCFVSRRARRHPGVPVASSALGS